MDYIFFPIALNVHSPEDQASIDPGFLMNRPLIPIEKLVLCYFLDIFTCEDIHGEDKLPKRISNLTLFTGNNINTRFSCYILQYLS